MFVCPIGLGLLAFCTNLLTPLKIHQLNCKNQPLNIDHSECCDIEMKHLANHCELHQLSLQSWLDFLHSDERNWKYLGDERHRSDLAGDALLRHLEIQEKEGFLIPLFPIVLGKYIGPRFYDRSNLRSVETREYDTPLNNGTIVCFKRRKANYQYCRPQVSAVKPRTLETICQEEFVVPYSCKSKEKEQQITLDLSIFLVKANEKKHNSDYIIKIPSLKDFPLDKKKFFLKKGEKQIQVGTRIETHSGSELKHLKNTISFKPTFDLYDKPQTTKTSKALQVTSTTEKSYQPLPVFAKERNTKSNSKMQNVIEVTVESTTMFEEVPLPFPTTTTTHRPKVTSKFKKTTTTASPYLDPPKHTKKDEKALTIDFPDIGRPLLTFPKTPVPTTTSKPPVKTPSMYKAQVKEKEKAFHSPNPTDQRTKVKQEKKKKIIHFYDIDL